MNSQTPSSKAVKNIDSSPKKLQDYIDSTLIIFAASLLAYIGAYCFELGYLRWFDINYQSARVQTESFVIAFIVLTPVLLIGHQFLGMLKDLRQELLSSRITK